MTAPVTPTMVSAARPKSLPFRTTCCAPAKGGGVKRAAVEAWNGQRQRESLTSGRMSHTRTYTR
eukprot:7386714-Prymnesium_polylepis.2